MFKKQTLKQKKKKKSVKIINKILNNKIINEYFPLIVMNFILYLLLVFIVPLIYTTTDIIKWLGLLIFITVILEIVITSFLKIKLNHIKFSVPLLYIFFGISINIMARKELYGVSNWGGLDPTVAWVDILILTFIITSIQYITLFIIYKIDNKTKRKMKANLASRKK